MVSRHILVDLAELLVGVVIVVDRASRRLDPDQRGEDVRDAKRHSANAERYDGIEDDMPKALQPSSGLYEYDSENQGQQDLLHV
jgi:hypothetical protein